MTKKYLTLVETYLSRFERGGFLVGDVFKFNNNYKSSESYKSLGYNTQQLIDQMLETGLHVRVVGIKDSTSPRYPGNPQTSSNDVLLTLALDNGGGRYTHYVTVKPDLGTSVNFYPNLPPIPDSVIRKNNINVKPKEVEKIDHLSNKTDKGDGTLSDTSRYLDNKNVQIPSTPVNPDPAVTAQTTDYLKGLKVFK